MRKIKKFLSQCRFLILSNAIVTYIAIALAILLIYLSRLFYVCNPFLSSTFMGVATGVISGIVLLIVTGIKNTWVYNLEEKIKWLDSIHNKILEYLRKESSYPQYCKNNSFEDRYNYVYDLAADASNINMMIIQAQFSKVLPFNPNKYFEKKYKYNTKVESEKMQELRETIINSDETEVFLSPQNVRKILENSIHTLSGLNSQILKDIESKKSLIMIAKKSIL